MAYLFSDHSGYLVGTTSRRLQRSLERGPDGLPIVPNVAISVTVSDDIRPGYGEVHDWLPLLNWLDEQQFWYWSHSPFTGEWRRYFAFMSAADAIAFKLRFS